MVRSTNNNNSVFNKLYNPLRYTFSRTTAIVNNDRKISVVVYITLITIVVDTMINQNVHRLVSQNTSPFGISLFIAMTSVCVIGQYLILSFAKEKTREIRTKSRYIGILQTIATVVQFFLIGVLIVVMIFIIVLQQYPTITLATVTTATYGLNIGLMGIFAQIFFSWYRWNRYSIAVLLYGLSFAIVVINSSIFLGGSLYRFMEKPSHIFPYSEVVFPVPEEGSFRYKLAEAYHFSDIAGFLLKWVATVFLLHHYSQKIGRIKYWVLVSIPLIYFLGTFLDDFHIYNPHSDEEKFYWRFYSSLNSTAGGILFGIGFMLGAKHFPERSGIKHYMMISGFGFILFFSAGQSTLNVTPYPPYGIATMSFFGLSTYLILVGLYCSAISVSEDIEIRKHIKKSAQREARFLDGIGTAHMEKELIKRMIVKAKEEQNELTAQSGGVKPSISESDIINIVKEVENDVRKEKQNEHAT
jgi:hypothetical protein